MEISIDYLLLKFLHILGGIVFVGNIIVTAFWKVMADRTREPTIAAFAQRLVNLTDFVFTSFGAFILLITGLMMAHSINEEITSVPWIAWGLGLFLVSGLIWGLILFPVQVRQAWLARNFSADNPIPDKYWRLGRIWILFGALAVIFPLVNVYLMVFKIS
jgi:uncharacterized membrane protein